MPYWDITLLKLLELFMFDQGNSSLNIGDNAITSLDVKMNREIKSDFLSALSLQKKKREKENMCIFFSHKLLHCVNMGVFR